MYNRPITSLGRKYVYVSKPFFLLHANRRRVFLCCKNNIFYRICKCAQRVKESMFLIIFCGHSSRIQLVNLSPEHFKVIVVYRDPRDVYLLNKYYWYKPPVSAPGAIPYFPTDVMKFCDEWKRMIYDCTGKKNVL